MQIIVGKEAFVLNEDFKPDLNSVSVFKNYIRQNVKCGMHHLLTLNSSTMLASSNLMSLIFNFKNMAYYELESNSWSFTINESMIDIKNLDYNKSMLFTYMVLTKLVGTELKQEFESFTDLNDYLEAFIWFYKSLEHLSSFKEKSSSKNVEDKTSSIFDLFLENGYNEEIKLNLNNCSLLSMLICLKNKVIDSSDHLGINFKKFDLPLILVKNSYLDSIKKGIKTTNLLKSRDTIFFKEETSPVAIVNLLSAIKKGKSEVSFIENDTHYLQNVFLNVFCRHASLSLKSMVFNNVFTHHNLNIKLGYLDTDLISKINRQFNTNSSSDSSAIFDNIGNILSNISDKELSSLICENSKIDYLINNKSKKMLTIYLKDPVLIKGFKYGNFIFHINDIEKFSKCLVEPLQDSGFSLCIFEFTIPYSKLLQSSGAINTITFLDQEVKKFHANVSESSNNLCLGLLRNINRLPDISMIMNTLSYFNFDSPHKNIRNYMNEQTVKTLADSTRLTKNILENMGLICFEI